MMFATLLSTIIIFIVTLLAIAFCFDKWKMEIKLLKILFIVYMVFICACVLNI